MCDTPDRLRAAYAADATLRLLADEWAAAGACPRPLVDRCLELDLPGAADCCRWASDPVFGSATPHPFQVAGTWYWYTTSTAVILNARLRQWPCRHLVPREYAACEMYYYGHSSTSAVGAVLNLMGLWKGRT